MSRQSNRRLARGDRGTEQRGAPGGGRAAGAPAAPLAVRRAHRALHAALLARALPVLPGEGAAGFFRLL